MDDNTIMAICTDFSRAGSAIYSESTLRLVADRKDPSDPYKGLDIVIQRINPSIVIISSVQRRLYNFLDKFFKFKTVDLDKIILNSRQEQKPTKRQRLQSGTENLAILQASQKFRTWNTNINQDNQPEQLDPNVGTQNIELNDPDPNPNYSLATNADLENIEDVTDHAFTLIIVPNRWFCMSHGIKKLTESELVKNSGFTKPEEKSFFVTSRVKQYIDVCAIRAIACIDKYLNYHLTKNLVQSPSQARTHTQCTITQQSRSQSNSVSTTMQVDSEDSLMPILDLRYIDPGPVLSIDRFTLQTLNIFPSQKSPDPTEDCVPSLFEVLNLCQSTQGKKQLRTMMLWPLQEMAELQNRLDTVEYFVQPENHLVRDQLCIQLKNIVPLTKLIVKMNQTVGTYRDLSILYKCLWSFLAIIDLVKSNQRIKPNIFEQIAALDSVEFRSTIESIINIVDFEASKREKRVQVCIGADELVDQKKDIVKNLSKFCDEIAVEETARYKDQVGKVFNVLYIPRIGFLNCIDYTSTSEIAKMSASKEFDILLHTERSIYFKTHRMEELDNNAGDIACDLIDLQEKVITDMQNEILKHSEIMLRLMELCGELDCLVAFALVSTRYGYTRPDFNDHEDRSFDIREAYHPLHCIKTQLTANEVRFYNDTSERHVKCMVITGPNSCGKTTYMKTVCLIAYMAHIGCFVPALYAKIPVIDAILTRMQSANSISTGLSSFATDLHQVHHALNRATERSIIAIDEFGKGTLAADGFHLLKGLIIYFASRGHKSPYIMIATHFNRIINHLQTYEEHIIYKTFRVKRDPVSNDIVYEFKLISGVCDSSLADKVAAKAGVPQSIIDRAIEIRDHLIQGRQINPRPPRDHAA